MLTSIHIQDFKGFKDTKIDTLKRVNLVVGGQNVGKTSLLEAIWLGTTPTGQLGGIGQELPQLFRPVDIGVNALKNGIEANGNDIYRFFKHLSAGQLKISTTNGTAYQFTYYEGAYSGSFPSTVGLPIDVRLCRSESTDLTFSPLAISIHLPSQKELVDLFSTISVPNKDIHVVDLLRLIETRLLNISILSPQGDTRLYVSLKGSSDKLPLSLLGHGFSRLLHLYCKLLISEADIALIDEIENGIHYSALPTVFEGIKDLAQTNDVQSIITTHSKECIRAASDAFKDSPDDFQVIRLVRKDDNVVAHIIPADYVAASLEMRGELR